MSNRDHDEAPGGVPPAAVLLGISSTIRLERALWVAARLGVADRLEPQGPAPNGNPADDGGNLPPPVPVETLARAVDANPDALYRVLRALAPAGIFSEASPRAFVHTPLSEPLRSDAPDSVREAILQHGDEPEWRAWGAILHTIRTGEPAFGHVWGESPWRLYEGTRARMTQISQRDSDVLAGHPLFGGSRHIVDVAGGEGGFLASLLRANPGTIGTLFDRPAIVDSAPALLERAGVGDRCTVVGGDMFESIPQGGDLYVLKRAIHDWDDEHVLIVLRSAFAAMQGQGRLVILTEIVSPGNAPSSAKLGDIALMVMLGGRHRTAREIGALVEAGGFELDEIVELPSPLSAIVAVPRGDARG